MLLLIARRTLVEESRYQLFALYSERQNSEAKAMFYFTAPPLDYDRHDVERQKKIVAEAFAGEGWEIPRLLKGMWDAPDFYFDPLSLVQMDSWSKGRVVLLGDAGYCASPLSGQGTSLALVGAYVLAGELKAAVGDYHTAFTNYEKEMREYVRLNQKSGASAGKQFIPPIRSMIWLTNQSIRMLPYMPWKNAILEAIRLPYDAIALKNYEG
jgi:2-polyprenyl-6-methoxyphenol hydroxylase-like FAD-dependent oxidoreductase